MKKLKIIVLIFLLLFIGFPITTVGALDSNYDYNIKKYKIDIIVNENNTYNITEYITAYFNVEKHGIIRKIPMKNKVIRLDGTTSSNNAKITNIKVTGGLKTITTNTQYKIIKIGDPDIAFTGSNDYVISYVYNIGNDQQKDYDEFYFNLIGSQWDTSISGVEFSITMPKEFDSSKLGFSSGYKNSTGNSNIVYNVNNNVITGYYIGALNPNEALSIRLELPEGYYINQGWSFDILLILVFLIPITLTVIQVNTWYKFGKNKEVVETVEFYPPKGFNSAEVAFAYKGYVTNIDVISLLIYLANKGFIEIVEPNYSESYSSTSKFTIKKIKDYDGSNENEKLFLENLFKKKPEVKIPTLKEILYYKRDTAEKSNKKPQLIEVNEITKKDLENNFYTTLEKITKNMNQEDNVEKLFEKKPLNNIKHIIIMISIIFLIINLKPMEAYGSFATTLPLNFFISIGLFLVIFSVIYCMNINLFVIVCFGLIFCRALLLFVLHGIVNEPIYIVAYIFGLACIIVILLTAKHMDKRTEYGNEILGKIKGFKNFLETVEKSKIEELVMQNPTYFYDILPYAYVLGVSNKWIKKFETIAMQAPTWSSRRDNFKFREYGKFIDRTMTSVSKSMLSSPYNNSSSRSSSGRSGGSSSGGGSGGGGGSSW